MGATLIDGSLTSFREALGALLARLSSRPPFSRSSPVPPYHPFYSMVLVKVPSYDRGTVSAGGECA